MKLIGFFCHLKNLSASKEKKREAEEKALKERNGLVAACL